MWIAAFWNLWDDFKHKWKWWCSSEENMKVIENNFKIVARGLMTGKAGKIHIWMCIHTINTEEEAVYDVRVKKWDTLETCESWADQSRATTDRSRAWYIACGPKNVGHIFIHCHGCLGRD